MPDSTECCPRFFRAPDWRTLAVFIWGLVLAAGLVRAPVNPTPAQVGIYAVYAEAGRHWLAGAPLYPKGDGWDVFPYSPLIATLFVPGSFLPDDVGSGLWRLALGVVFLLALSRWARSALPGALDVNQRAILALLLLPLAAPTVLTGQMGGLVAAAILVTMAAAAEGRWNLSAAAVVFACLLKVYPVSVALLLALCYPRRMGLRLLVAGAVGASLPFLLQRPGYVAEQYAGWVRLMHGSDRLNWPLDIANRNLSLLFRVWLTPFSHEVHLASQLAAAASVAGLCLLLRRRGLPRPHLLLAVLGLAGCWMTLFGPVVESYTYILVAPTLAWMVWRSWQEPRAWPYRAVLLASWAIFTAAAVAVWFTKTTPLYRIGPHPVAGLLLLGCILWDALRELRAPTRLALVAKEGVERDAIPPLAA
jgi:hypothetical protein